MRLNQANKRSRDFRIVFRRPRDKTEALIPMTNNQPLRRTSGAATF